MNTVYKAYIVVQAKFKKSVRKNNTSHRKR